MIWFTVLRALGCLRSAFLWLGALVTRYPLQCALVASLALNVGLCQRGNRYRDHYAAFVAQTKAANAKATADQAIVNHQPAAISVALAEKSNADNSIYETGRRAGAAYAASHGLRAICTGGASLVSVPRADHPAPLDDGPRIAAELDGVAVSGADFDTCTSNSGRLAKVRQDAQALIAAGVAIVESH